MARKIKNDGITAAAITKAVKHLQQAVKFGEKQNNHIQKSIQLMSGKKTK